MVLAMPLSLSFTADLIRQLITYVAKLETMCLHKQKRKWIIVVEDLALFHAYIVKHNIERHVNFFLCGQREAF